MGEINYGIGRTLKEFKIILKISKTLGNSHQDILPI